MSSTISFIFFASQRWFYDVCEPVAQALPSRENGRIWKNGFVTDAHPASHAVHVRRRICGWGAAGSSSCWRGCGPPFLLPCGCESESYAGRKEIERRKTSVFCDDQ